MRKKQQKKDVVEQILSTPPSATDPQGSWTGLPLEAGEQPVQDADDL